MSKSRAQLEMESDRRAREAARRELAEARTRWSEIRARWEDFDQERRIVAAAYGSDHLDLDEGIFAREVPLHLTGLLRFCDEAEQYLESRTRRFAAQRRRAIAGSGVARLEAESTGRQFRFDTGESTGPSPEGEELLDELWDEIERVTTRFFELGPSSAAQDVFEELGAALDVPGIPAWRAHRVCDEMRDLCAREQRRVDSERLKATETGYETSVRLTVEELWAELEGVGTVGADALRTELERFLEDPSEVPLSLFDRVATEVTSVDRKALADSVAATFAEVSSYSLPTDFAESLAEGVPAFVTSQRYDGHGLCVTLDSDQIDVAPVRAADATPNASAEDEWCSSEQAKVYAALGRRSVTVEEVYAHQTGTLAAVPAGTLPSRSTLRDQRPDRSASRRRRRVSPPGDS